MNQKYFMIGTYINFLRKKFKYFNSKLILIHIGKCGGSSVRKDLENAGISFYYVHVNTVKYDPSKKYIFLLRNPIDRFVSAFYWRKKNVIEFSKPINEYEKKMFNKYKDVNSLALDIYDDHGNIQLDLKKESNYIHHIVQDIDFHIGSLLEKIHKNDIHSVITTENIVEDIKNSFNIDIKSHEKSNKNQYSLSDTAYSNLKKYLSKDYECIKKLFEIGAINKNQYRLLNK
tara:strand:+ start:4165 stop:4854 length:690 start_codon:yes stop_codon:yes gene_type:complete